MKNIFGNERDRQKCPCFYSAYIVAENFNNCNTFWKKTEKFVIIRRKTALSVVISWNSCFFSRKLGFPLDSSLFLQNRSSGKNRQRKDEKCKRRACTYKQINRYTPQTKHTKKRQEIAYKIWYAIGENGGKKTGYNAPTVKGAYRQHIDASEYCGRYKSTFRKLWTDISFEY